MADNRTKLLQQALGIIDDWWGNERDADWKDIVKDNIDAGYKTVRKAYTEVEKDIIKHTGLTLREVARETDVPELESFYSIAREHLIPFDSNRIQNNLSGEELGILEDHLSVDTDFNKLGVAEAERDALKTLSEYAKEHNVFSSPKNAERFEELYDGHKTDQYFLAHQAAFSKQAEYDYSVSKILAEGAIISNALQGSEETGAGRVYAVLTKDPSGQGTEVSPDFSVKLTDKVAESSILVYHQKDISDETGDDKQMILRTSNYPIACALGHFSEVENFSSRVAEVVIPKRLDLAGGHQIKDGELIAIGKTNEGEQVGGEAWRKHLEKTPNPHLEAPETHFSPGAQRESLQRLAQKNPENTDKPAGREL